MRPVLDSLGIMDAYRMQPRVMSRDVQASSAGADTRVHLTARETPYSMNKMGVFIGLAVAYVNSYPPPSAVVKATVTNFLYQDSGRDWYHSTRLPTSSKCPQTTC